MDKAVNKKEYLKKYLSGDHKKKRKKKVTSSTLVKSKIIDDDIDLKNMRPLDDNELEIYDLAEDAPQIAGIVDDRPDEVRIMSEFRQTKKWKIVTRDYEDVKVSSLGDSDPEIERGSSSIAKRNNYDSDASPPRKELKKVDRGRISTKRPSPDSDASPPRKGGRREQSPESDQSPPRKRTRENHPGGSRQEKRGNIKEDSDEEPPRRRSKSRKYKSRADSDAESPKKSFKFKQELSDTDLEPPRKHTKHNIDHRHTRNDKSDVNECREKMHSKSKKRASSDDESPRRPNRGHDVPHPHKETKRKSVKKESEDESPPRRSKEDPRHDTSRLTKTLDGRKAGLQGASAMREEAADIRRKQAESLGRLGDDVSGRGAAAIMRDKKTGKKRDMKEEARLRREKEAKDAEIAEKYAVWGKGVKQVDDRAAKMQDDLHEMSKPVARYADDEDLEEMRRNEEKEGDPMLEYIRSRRKKEGHVPSGKPRYQGSYLPNRYGIRPGHRWDGVDRSNGYEKKWFEEKNAKKARDEEAFKWSTEDM